VEPSKYTVLLPQPAPPALHAAHIPSTIPGSGGQVTPGAEMTGQAQIINALSAPLVLEAGTDVIDAEPDSELARR
jgi:hypothetical protein